MPNLDQILEAILFASEKPLTVERLFNLLKEKADQGDGEVPDKQSVRDAISGIQGRYQQNGVVQLKEVASGFRFQIEAEYAPWVRMLHEERPPRYSRALMETLAIIAYRQPITRGEIEDIRGVAVSTSIIKTIQEREWVRVVGHKDVPGKPALYATTRQFLDYFDLRSLEQLPPLAEVRNLDEIARSLESGSVPKDGNNEIMPLAGVAGPALPKAEQEAEQEAGQEGNQGNDSTSEVTADATLH